MNTFNIGGRLLQLDSPLIMGVINITPDSFYDESRILDPDKLIQRVNEMIDEGVDIVDLGAFSSRPGAKTITAEEECSRLIPAVKLLRTTFPDIVLSVDTYRSKVLEQVVDHSACIVNDISGYEKDPDILNIVRSNNLPYVLMHMQGSPENMQDDPNYADVSFEIIDFMAAKLHDLKQKGIEQIIIDPGFGFGKTLEHNFQLLNNLEAFKIFEKSILVGLSRKSMIYKLLDTTPDKALNGTSIAHTIALMNGADILRVHDVREARECVRICKALKN